MSTASGVSSMIGFSVRLAVPFIFLVVAASSSANTVSWIVLEVVVTQPKIHRDVFCSCNVVARLVHFYNVLLFPRLLL